MLNFFFQSRKFHPTQLIFPQFDLQPIIPTFYDIFSFFSNASFLIDNFVYLSIILIVKHLGKKRGVAKILVIIIYIPRKK